MTIFKRLKTLWKLSELNMEIPKHSMNGLDSPLIDPKELGIDYGYKFQGKPEAQIIKKENIVEDAIEEITK